MSGNIAQTGLAKIEIFAEPGGSTKAKEYQGSPEIIFFKDVSGGNTEISYKDDVKWHPLYNLKAAEVRLTLSSDLNVKTEIFAEPGGSTKAKEYQGSPEIIFFKKIQGGNTEISYKDDGKWHPLYNLKAAEVRVTMEKTSGPTPIGQFFPANAPVPKYGNQFVRGQSGQEGGTIEFNTPTKLAPANARLYVEGGIPRDMKGHPAKQNGDEITIIYKENHGAEGEKSGKHNVKVKLEFRNASDGNPARYTDKVELGAEDDHDADTNPEEFEGVKYQNTDVLTKYKTGGEPIRAKGSYQDTPDNGVRYKLEVQDPDTKEWKKIFDHVDYGDDNHKIENYRGRSAKCSCIRTDGSTTTDFDKDALDGLKDKSVNIKKTEKQQEELKKFGYGYITYEEIGPDDGKWNDGIDDPLSFGKK